MIFDHRTYVCKPGTLPAQMELYETYGRAAQEKHLGKPILYGITETGRINSYIHVWAYEDAADRARRRAAMQADPDWQDFVRRAGEAGYLVSQENQILLPPSFFDLTR